MRNLGPILLSVPMACATSDTLAPVASHTAEMALILEILWARNALAAYNARTRKKLLHLRGDINVSLSSQGAMAKKQLIYGFKHHSWAGKKDTTHLEDTQTTFRT